MARVGEDHLIPQSPFTLAGVALLTEEGLDAVLWRLALIDHVVADLALLDGRHRGTLGDQGVLVTVDAGQTLLPDVQSVAEGRLSPESVKGEQSTAQSSRHRQHRGQGDGKANAASGSYQKLHVVLTFNSW
jgi:hypothetical protein